jgi:dienelactone hydrolase
MRKLRVGGAVVTIALVLAAGGCLSSPPVSVTPPALPALPAPTVASPPPPIAYATYPVGMRILHLHRGRHRPLRTLVFYPATGRVPWERFHAVFPPKRWAAVAGRPKGIHGEVWTALTPAAGRFPLVLFSHGLSGSAERYADTLAHWASAGFVVAAPTFPNTSEFTEDFDRPDIVNQPADARYVLARVERLNTTAGDPLEHRIDTDHMAAVGHSAGGYTTTGLFTPGHDPRLRAGVIMAGWAAKGAFGGPPATLLFLQGRADPIVPVATSRALYDRVPWPKSYLLMRRDSHATYLRPGDIGYNVMNSTVVDFLRWTLKHDESAHRRLPPTVYPSPGLADLDPDHALLADAD